MLLSKPLKEKHGPNSFPSAVWLLSLIHIFAPAVRAAWGEALGLSREEATIGKIMDALKKIGVDYVFDTSFSADLTIMEEGNEFLQRFTKGELKLRPMFTSCCPGWIRFIKSQYPHLVPQLDVYKRQMKDKIPQPCLP